MKPEYALSDSDPTQENPLVPQGIDTSSVSPSSSYSLIPSSDPTKNHFMYVCKKKWKNIQVRMKNEKNKK